MQAGTLTSANSNGADMPLVNIYLIRHPEHLDNVLTDLGKEQIRESANRLLSSIGFDIAIHSEVPRALRTVNLVLETLKQTSVPVLQRELGFDWAIADSELPPYAESGGRPDYEAAREAIVAKRGADPRRHLVSDWFELCPRMLALRGSVRTTLLDVARELNRDANILAGSHSPTGDLAVIQPRKTFCLGLADVMKYVVEVNTSGRPQLVASENLSNPWREPDFPDAR
jgi:broad specificity phosphatase PhoE